MKSLKRLMLEIIVDFPAGILGAESLNGRLGFCRDLRDSDELSTVNCNEAVLQQNAME